MSDVLSTFEVNINESLHLQPAQDTNNSFDEYQHEEKQRQADLDAQVNGGELDGILDEDESYATEIEEEEEEEEEEGGLETTTTTTISVVRTSTPIVRTPLPPPIAPALTFQNSLAPVFEHPSEGLLVDLRVLHELEWLRGEYQTVCVEYHKLEQHAQELKANNELLARVEAENNQLRLQFQQAEEASSRTIQTLNSRLQKAEDAEQLKLHTLAKENEELRETLKKSQETVEELRKSETEAERLKKWREECCEREFNLLEPEKKFAELTSQVALLKEKEAASVGLAEQLALSRTEAEKTRVMYQEIVLERDTLELKLRQEFERECGLKMERQLSTRLAEERLLAAEKQKQERDEMDAKARQWRQGVQAELQGVQKELAEAKDAVEESRRQKTDSETKLTAEIHELKRRLCEVEAASKQAAQSHSTALQRLEDAKSALEAAQKEAERLKSTVINIGERNSELEKELADREAEFEQAKAAWKKEAEQRFYAFQHECRAKLGGLVAQLGAERNLTSKIGAETQSLREEIVRLEQDKKRAIDELVKEQETARAKHKLLVKKAVRDRVLQLESTTKAEIDELKARLEAAASFEAESRRELAQLKTEARTQSQTIEQLRQSLTDSNCLVDSIKLEIDRLQHEKTELKTRCADLDDQVRRLIDEQRRAREHKLQILEEWKRKLLNHMDVHAASVHDELVEYISADRANLTAQINGWLVPRIRGHLVQSGLTEGFVVKFLGALRRDLETTLTPLPLPESLTTRSKLPDSLITTPPQPSPSTSLRLHSASSLRKSTTEAARSNSKRSPTPRKPFRC